MSTDSGAKWYQSSAGIGTSSIDDLLGEADLALRSDGGSSPSWAAGGNNCNSAFGTLPSRASAASSSASSSLEFGTPRPPTTVRASANINPKSRFVSMNPKPLMTDGAGVTPNDPSAINIRTPSVTTRPPISSYGASSYASNGMASAATSGPLSQQPQPHPTLTSSSGTSSRPKAELYVDDVLNDLEKIMKPSTTKSAPNASNFVGLSTNKASAASSAATSLPTVGGADAAGHFTMSKNEYSQTSASSMQYVQSSPLPVASSSASSDFSTAIFPRAVSGAPGVKNNRCIRIAIAGAKVPRGLRASAFSKCACDSLRCVQCNFEVLCFEGRRWADDVDYMFFRNCVPNRDKLLSKLVSESVDVANNCAYCCQCSWINAQDERILGIGTSELQWVCGGHPN